MNELNSDVESDRDSLFDSDISGNGDAQTELTPGSSRPNDSSDGNAPDISGLFFFPNLLPRGLHDQVLQSVAACGYFVLDFEDVETLGERRGSSNYARNPRNQVMLFGRSHLGEIQSGITGNGAARNESGSGLPEWSEDLITRLRVLVEGQAEVPSDVKEMLFPTDRRISRQLILNLYTRGEGLFPHVDLVNRFADGIMLCSFGPTGTGTVMDFYHDDGRQRHLYLPSGSVLILSKEARYDWKHGITARDSDLVQFENVTHEVRRSIRLSITIRAMLPGADIVGEE
ncbi:hypothetical protein BCV70DRAFT_210111 [Testicularia cyperi]|uniref:Fe2OG dioxygenase domain-containing protein n=1 Tax=Testicularia cyperi TaxID=1882483 RepID=A0A317XU74_9BASI|nr:hypothetical protein BCV70DRAFT_210111 [Testicularia cyperi]